MRLVLQVKGVISVTFDMNKKRCFLRVKPDIKPEVFWNFLSCIFCILTDGIAALAMSTIQHNSHLQCSHNCECFHSILPYTCIYKDIHYRYNTYMFYSFTDCSAGCSQVHDNDSSTGCQRRIWSRSKFFIIFPCSSCIYLNMYILYIH